MFFLLLTFGITLFLTYIYGTRNHDYWKKKGIKHDSVLPFFGTNIKPFFQTASYAVTVSEMYKKYPQEKVIGYYKGTKPELIIRDLDIIKRLLITDFQHFHTRGAHPDPSNVETLLKNLFNLEGDSWRLMRQNFTPVFSSAKLKAMFPLITGRTEKLQNIAEISSKKDSCDMLELMARFMTELIGVCTFGIDMDCMSNESSQFRKLGKEVFERTPRDALAYMLKTLFPTYCKSITLYKPSIQKTVSTLVRNILEQRNYKPSGINDFIDLLLELKQKTEADIKSKKGDLEIDDSTIIAHCFLFFAAGFETSATSSSFTIHQLAFNPDCQKKAQEEIDKILIKYNNKITYDAVKEMSYLRMAFFEAMRISPPSAYLERKCTSVSYTIPEIGLTIDNGVRIIVPMKGLHNDEQYFENPELFIPERFDPQIYKTNNYPFMPFGEGPRACIGARMGEMQAIAAIAAILQKFNVEPAASSVKNPLPDPRGFITESFVGGLPLKLSIRT